MGSGPSSPGSSSPAGDTVGDAQVFGGSRSAVPLVSTKPVRLLMPRGAASGVAARIVYTGPLGPGQKGARGGRLQVMRGDMRPSTCRSMPARISGHDSQRALDGLFEVGTGWVRRAFASLVESG